MKWDINDFAERIYKYSRNNIISVLLRHSIREEIIDRDSLRNAQLTNEGEKLAYEFGKLLPKDRLIRIFHSPISRCKDTAELICQGIRDNHGSALMIGERDFLGGTYILKGHLIFDLFTDLGVSGFVEKWFRGGFDKTILHPPKRARNDMINSLIQCNQNNSKEIDLHVSHDLNIILFKAVLFNVLSEDFKWPEFMEGIIFKKIDNELILYVEDKEKVIHNFNFYNEI
ncbi:MAG: histidine phosphatase family protein [Candidatus Hodarchaeota archaeon]